MFISTCGFGATGSSAVTDYLRECEGITVIDQFEFTLAHCVDGLADLEYHVMLRNSRQLSSIYAIQRFEKLIKKNTKKWCANTAITEDEIRTITYRFLDDITQLEYVTNSPRINKRHSEFLQETIGESLMRRKIMPKLEKKGIIKKNIDYYPLDMVRVSIKPNNFYEATQTFVSDLLHAMGAPEGQHIAMDQAFVGNDPAASFPFFKNPYAIVVDRDPIDLFIFARKKLLSVGRFIASDTVDHFVTYYRLLRENQPYLEDNDRVLRIRFEDLVYNYESTADQIDRFLGVTNTQRKTVFQPEKSVANTHLITRFPEFKANAEQIAEALPEYIFPFEKYPDVSNEGKMFFGRALKQR